MKFNRARPARLELAHNVSQLHRISELLEVYHLEMGKYPLELDDLVKAGLVNPEEILDRNGRKYSYKSDENSFSLRIQVEGHIPDPEAEPEEIAGGQEEGKESLVDAAG